MPFHWLILDRSGLVARLLSTYITNVWPSGERYQPLKIHRSPSPRCLLHFPLRPGLSLRLPACLCYEGATPSSTRKRRAVHLEYSSLHRKRPAFTIPGLSILQFRPFRHELVVLLIRFWMMSSVLSVNWREETTTHQGPIDQSGRYSGSQLH